MTDGTPLAAAVDAFLIELRVERGLSPLTIEAYRRDLAQFAEHAGGERWRDDPGPLNGFVAHLQQHGAKGTTQARKSAAVRSFYAFALREGLATRDIPALIDAPRPGSYLPDVLAPEDVASILDAPPPDDPVGIRDRAILELLYACGLRVSELVGLDTDRVDLPNLQVRVIGKGNKERRVPMGEEAASASTPIGPVPARLDGEAPDAGGLRQPAGRAAETRIGVPHGAPVGARRRGGRSGSRRTRFGTASPPICSRAGPTCAWSRRSSAMLASAPPSSTPT